MKVFSWFLDRVVWAAFILPALSAWLKDTELAPWVSSFFGHIYGYTVALVGEPAFPWVAGLSLGFVIGIFVFRLWVWQYNTGNERKFERLEGLMVEVRNHISDLPYRSGMDKNIAGLQANIHRLFSALDDQGISRPTLSDEFPIAIVEYINFIEPFIKDRDMNVVRRAAINFLEKPNNNRQD